MLETSATRSTAGQQSVYFAESSLESARARYRASNVDVRLYWPPAPNLKIPIARPAVRPHLPCLAVVCDVKLSPLVGSALQLVGACRFSSVWWVFGVILACRPLQRR